jgi:hypothetical protein
MHSVLFPLLLYVPARHSAQTYVASSCGCRNFPGPQLLLAGQSPLLPGLQEVGISPAKPLKAAAAPPDTILYVNVQLVSLLSSLKLLGPAALAV